MASLPLDQEGVQARPVAAYPLPRAEGLSLVDWRDFSCAEAIAEWDSLASDAAEPNPFYESWSLLPALANLDRDGNAQLALLRVEGRLCGLVPLVRTPRYYGYPLRNVTNWLHHNAFCGAPLVAKGHGRAFWTALLHHCDTNPGGTLFLHLTHLPEHGVLHDALREVSATNSRPCAIVHREIRAMLQSSHGPDAYFEGSVSAKKRKELRRQHSRLSELGTLRFHRYADSYKIDSWCDDFLALEQSGWKGEAGSALACDPATASMFRISLHGASSRGRLERLSLTLDGKPIAMLVNYLTAPGSYAFKTTFDENFARYSPGVLLQRENLALLDRRDIEWSDSCAGQDHPMIDRIWREKRGIVRVSVGIGGHLRRSLFKQLLRRELNGKGELLS